MRINADSLRTKAARQQAQQVRADGGVPLCRADWDKVHAMAAALADDREAVDLLKAAPSRELSAFTVDDESGTWLRVRFDAIGDVGIVDYKTSRSADPSEFARAAAAFGYHVQAAMYRFVAADLGITDGPFRFVVQEKEPPYLVSVIELDDEAERAGWLRLRRAIDTWATCTAYDTWPGYQPGITTISIPQWALAKEEEL